MTSFQKEAQEPALPETKTEEPAPPILTSRLKADPKLWEDAYNLATMLTYCRPAFNKTEHKFIGKFIWPIGVKFDGFGNAYKQIGNAPIMWSCHTDTVHNTGGFQRIEFIVDQTSGDTFFQVGAGERSSCLGADDTTGVWLMLDMIKREVPGLYIFHRAEEVGGKGSKFISEKNKDLVKDIKFAIAFDRRGEKSIITHQRSRLCCSDEFAKSLADGLGMGHVTDDTGSFTDTASYVDLIAECTNVSTGYDNAHMKSERTNVDYLLRLRDALCKLDLTKLVEKRKPGENTWKPYKYESYKAWDYESDCVWSRKESDFHTGGWTGRTLSNFFGTQGWVEDFNWDNGTMLWYYKKAAKNADLGDREQKKGKKNKSRVDRIVDSAQLRATIKKLGNAPHGYRGSYREMLALIRENPEIIADLLESQGYGPPEVREHILSCGLNGNSAHFNH